MKIDNIWLDDISAPSVERLGSILLANRTSILVLLNRFSSRQCKLNRFNIFTRAISKFKILILMLRVNHKTEITVYRLVWDWERCLSKISNSMSPCLLFRFVELKMTNEKAPILGRNLVKLKSLPLQLFLSRYGPWDRLVNLGYKLLKKKSSRPYHFNLEN